MCGLAGALTSWLSDPEVKNFKLLMTLAQTRGRDGSGVIMIPDIANKPLGIVRSLDCADTMVHSDVFDKQFEETKRIAAIIGHARYPTSGGVELADMHPVTVDHISGVHNGTMTVVNSQKVATTDHDTVMLFDSIAKHGVEETIKHSIGDYCLVWVDTKDRTINFIRNAGRPLFFGHYENNSSTIYWASEMNMLWYMLSRNDSRKIALRQLPVNTLFSFPIGRTQIKENKKIEPVGVKDTTPPFVYTPPEQRPRRGSVPIVNPKETALEKAFADAAMKRGTPEAGDIHVQYGPQLQYVAPMNKLKLLLSNGCCVCGNPADYDYDLKNRKVHFFNSDMFMCEACKTRDPTSAMILEQSAGRAYH